VAGLKKRYGDVVGLGGVELTIAAGEFFTLLGPSGSGKTTLLRLIAGFERPDAGRIELGGSGVTGVPPYFLLTIIPVVLAARNVPVS
jgi:ABC-type Fe3+/spermidine/putrescine transport system ATPase subunit